MVDIGWLEDPIAEKEALDGLDTHRQMLAIYRSIATEQMAVDIAVAASLYPSSSAALTVGSTFAGIPSDDDLRGEAEALEIAHTNTRGGISGFVHGAIGGTGDVIRGITRTAALAFNGVYDEFINRPLRTAANQVGSGHDIWDLNQIGESYANSGNAPFASFGEYLGKINPFQEGGAQEANLGTGWLPSSKLAKPVEDALGEMKEAAQLIGGNDPRAEAQMMEHYAQTYGLRVPSGISPAQQQMVFISQMEERILEDASSSKTELGRAQAEFGDPIVQRQYAEANSTLLDMSGFNAPWLKGKQYQQVSVGRVFAGLVVEPGTQPFHWMSGTADFLANIFMDPANLVGGAIAKTRKAGKAVQYEKAADELGVIQGQLDEADAAFRDEALVHHELVNDPDMVSFDKWSPKTQNTALGSAPGEVTQKLVDEGHYTQRQLERQKGGLAARNYQAAEGRRLELQNDPDLIKYEGYTRTTRSELERYADRDLAWFQQNKPGLASYYDTAAKRNEIIGKIRGEEDIMARTAADADYQGFLKLNPQNQRKALKSANEAYIDPAVHKNLAKYQRIGRRVIQLSDEIEQSGRKLDELENLATYDHQIRKAMGIIDGNPRKGVDVKQASDFLGGGQAARFVDDLTKADLAGVDYILSNIKGHIPRKLRLALADSTDQEEVVGHILSYIGREGTFPIREVGKKMTFKDLANDSVRVHAAVGRRVANKTKDGVYVTQKYGGSKLSRWFHEMSPGAIDLNNMDEAYDLIELYATNLGWSRGDEVLEGHMRAIAELNNGDYRGAFEVLTKFGQSSYDRLIDGGLNPELARRMTRFFSAHQEQGKWFVDRLGDDILTNMRTTKHFSDGTSVTSPGPGLITELFKGTLHMPDPRLIRHGAAELDKMGQALNKITSVWNQKTIRAKALGGLDNIMTKYWKPAVLLRLAWPVRVIAEEQARMMAMGVTRPYTHPVHHIAMAIARSKTGIKDADVLGKALSSTEDIPFGQLTDWQKAKAGRVNFQGDYRPTGVSFWQTVNRDIDGYGTWLDGYVEEINQLWTDPIVQHLFDPNTSASVSDFDRVTATVNMLMEPTGNGPRLLAQLAATADEGTKAALKTRAGVTGVVESAYARAHLKAGGDMRRIELGGAWKDSRGMSGQLEPGSWAGEGRLSFEVLTPTSGEKWTLADPEMLEAFGTGKFRGLDISSGHKSEDALQAMRAEIDAFARSKINLPVTVKGIKDPTLEEIGNFDKLVGHLFNITMSKPTNYLSRSPAFRTSYWRRMGEMSRVMDEPTKAKALAGAKKAGVEKEFLEGAGISKQIVIGQKQLDSAGLITRLEEVDEIAKSMALTDVQDLLFDVSKRKNASDVLRIIMPFADAWGEVLGTWAKITRQQNIKPFRRFQQIIESGRESNPFDATSGWTNEGFFQSKGGREVFTVPGLNKLWSSLSGVESEWEYSLQGMSIATDVLPGVGPVVQIPAQQIIPNSPEWEWLKDIVIPFGASSPQKSLTPSSWQRLIASMDWSRNLFQDKNMEDLYQSAVTDVLAQMEQADPMGFQALYRSNPEGLMSDARSQASQLFVIQALARFVGPAAPSTKPTLEDKTGRVWQMSLLHDEMFKMLEENSRDRLAATEQFIERFGIDPIFINQAKTTEITPAPESTVGYNFQRENPELYENFPNIAFYLGPARLDDVLETDWDAYHHQKAEGIRESLDADTWLNLANDGKGRMALAKAKHDLEERYGLDWNEAGWDPKIKAEAGTMLANYAAELMQIYPGYTGAQFGVDVAGVPSRVEWRVQIADWERLIREHPDLVEDNDGAFAVSEYMKIREYANQVAQQTTDQPSTMSGGAGDPSSPHFKRRQILRIEAAKLIAEFPDFGPIWEMIFSKELATDQEEEMTVEDAYRVLGLTDGL